MKDVVFKCPKFDSNDEINKIIVNITLLDIYPNKMEDGTISLYLQWLCKDLTGNLFILTKCFSTTDESKYINIQIQHNAYLTYILNSTIPEYFINGDFWYKDNSFFITALNKSKSGITEFNLFKIPTSGVFDMIYWMNKVSSNNNFLNRLDANDESLFFVNDVSIKLVAKLDKKSIAVVLEFSSDKENIKLLFSYFCNKRIKKKLPNKISDIQNTYLLSKNEYVGSIDTNNVQIIGINSIKYFVLEAKNNNGDIKTILFDNTINNIICSEIDKLIN